MAQSLVSNALLLSQCTRYVPAARIASAVTTIATAFCKYTDYFAAKYEMSLDIKSSLIVLAASL